ncbi:MAG: hypothetical protein ACTSRU_20930 [Candidatus Hodarchaeales archaeon]
MAKTVTWVDTAKDFEVGDRILLKGDNSAWNVEEIYDKTMEAKEVNRTWNRGGIGKDNDCY